jgi:hypothetical protein
MIKLRDVYYCTEHDGIPARHDWICYESMWRLAPCSIWHRLFPLALIILFRITSFSYVINELLSIAIYPSSFTNPETLRLPSTRSLWAAKSNIEWQRQYARRLSKRQSKDGLSIGHLRQYAGYSGDCSTKKGLAADTEDWCLEHDELGALIWMTTKLQVVSV